MTITIPDSLLSEFNKEKLLAVGEIHGVVENADLYQLLVEKLGIEVLALEWPTGLAHVFDAYFQTGKLEGSDLEGYLGDGRINKEHLEIFRRLYDNKLIKNFIYFDNYEDYSNDSSWNNRDASYSREFLSRYDTNLKTLIVAGNLHATSKPFEADFEDGILEPMVYHLQQELGVFPVVEIQYGKGEFYNYGVQVFGSSDSNQEPGFIAEEDMNYTFQITTATPVTLPSLESDR